MAEFIVRGVPASIVKDAWWLTSEATQPAPSHRPSWFISTGSRRALYVSLILIALIAFADVLFWGHAVGLSLILFSGALCTAALISLRPNLSPRTWLWSGIAWIACALPVIEYVQFASVLILCVGHAGLLVRSAMRTATWSRLLRSVIALPWLATLCAIAAGSRAVQVARVPNGLSLRRETLLSLVLPTLASGVFVVLLIGANPLFARWIDALGEVQIDTAQPGRILFWGIAAIGVAPFVAFATLAKRFDATPRPARLRAAGGNALVNPASITLSLILFNALFLTQNLADLAILWGGAALPEGMTFAQYAHNGAYPLMATSTLAGVFVLMSRRFIANAPLVRILLLVWIVQNLFLVGSALARLDLYIEAYGLTYLRVRAGIGMVLILIGMGLLAWQVWAQRSNAWVTNLFACLCAATLYAGCFVNFGALIARENLSRPAERLDTRFLCHTLPHSVGALHEHALATGDVYCKYQLPRLVIAPEGWRDFGLRNARLATLQRAYLKTHAPVTLPLSGSNTAPNREGRDDARHSYRGR